MRTSNTTASLAILYWFACVSMIAGLVACGGGGGGGSGGNGISLPTGQVTITQQNSLQVAGAAIDALYGGATLAKTGKIPAPAPTAIAAISVANIVQTAAQQLIMQGAAPATVTAAVQTIPCTFGGTETLNTTSPASGIVTYNNCSNVAGETINGTMSLSNIISTPSYLSVDAYFNLTVTTVSPSNTLTAIGDMHLYLDAATLTISGSSLAMGNTHPALGNLGLQNYSITTYSSGTITANFSFASTVINGTAVFTMSTPFAHDAAGLFPISGIANIAGANSSVLKLTVLGNENAVGNQVQFELSTDGGANYAAPAYHTWAEISSRI